MNITKEKMEEINVLMSRYLGFDKFYSVTFTSYGISFQGKFNKELYLDFIDDGFELDMNLESGYTFVRLKKNNVTVVFDVKGTLEEMVELKKEMGWD
jgi:hypothetical protein